MSKKEKRGKSHLNGWFYTFLVLDVIAISLLFVIYGPFDGFRNFWITSSMTTMTHHYLAKTFYSDDVINETLNNNTVEILNTSTDASEIVFSNSVDTGIYESEYEEQILKRDEGNELYKLFDIKVNGSTAHIAVIYDPSRIHYTISSKNNRGGQQLVNLAKEQGAIIAINASAFTRRGLKVVPTGITIKDGKVLQNGGLNSKYGIVGFNNDNVLILSKCTAQEAIDAGIRDAMSFGPFLYVNGVAAKINGNGGWGYAPRTVIAQRKDGIVLFLVVNNEVINKTGGFGYSKDRYLPDAWIVK